MSLGSVTIADDLDPISELHILDQFWQPVVAVDPAPAFLRALARASRLPGSSPGYLDGVSDRGSGRTRISVFRPSSPSFAITMTPCRRTRNSLRYLAELQERPAGMAARLAAPAFLGSKPADYDTRIGPDNPTANFSKLCPETGSHFPGRTPLPWVTPAGEIVSRFAHL